MELVLRLVVCLRSSPVENSHEHSHHGPPPAEMAAPASTPHTRPNLECRRARLIGPPSMKKCFSLVTRGSTECFFVRWWHWSILRAIDPLQLRPKYMCLLGGLYSIDPTWQRGTQFLLWGDRGLFPQVAAVVVMTVVVGHWSLDSYISWPTVGLLEICLQNWCFFVETMFLV